MDGFATELDLITVSVQEQYRTVQRHHVCLKLITFHELNPHNLTQSDLFHVFFPEHPSPESLLCYRDKFPWKRMKRQLFGVFKNDKFKKNNLA